MEFAFEAREEPSASSHTTDKSSTLRQHTFANREDREVQIITDPISLQQENASEHAR